MWPTILRTFILFKIENIHLQTRRIPAAVSNEELTYGSQCIGKWGCAEYQDCKACYGLPAHFSRLALNLLILLGAVSEF